MVVWRVMGVEVGAVVRWEGCRGCGGGVVLWGCGRVMGDWCCRGGVVRMVLMVSDSIGKRPVTRGWSSGRVVSLPPLLMRIHGGRSKVEIKLGSITVCI